MKHDLTESVEAINEFIETRRQLVAISIPHFSQIVETIIRTKSTDTHFIEHTLDGLLDICFDESILELFKSLCRYYYNIDPLATVTYVEAYRNMWDSDAKMLEDV